MSDGTLDLALIVDSRLHDDRLLSSTPLLAEELVVISAKGSPAPAPGARMPIRALRDRPLVMFRRGYDLRDATVAACRAEGFEPSFAIEGGEMDTVLAFVSAGIGLAVVPSTVVGDRFHTTRFSAPGLTRTVQLAYRRQVEPTRAVRALREAIMSSLDDAARHDRMPFGTKALFDRP